MENPQSLAHAKQLLRDLELRKEINGAMIGEYRQLLNVVVDAITKLTTDDEKSDTSLTVPETIGSDSRSFFFCGGSVTSDDTYRSNKGYGWIEEQQETEPHDWKRDLGRDEERDAAENDDDISISSDVIPLYMTDDDALDEIDFTRELMGYVEGFEATEMPISRIEEGYDDEEMQFEPYVPAKPVKSPSKSVPSRNPHLPPLARPPPPPRRPEEHLQSMQQQQQQQRQSPSLERSSQSGSRTCPVPSKNLLGHRRHRSGSGVPSKAADGQGRKEDPPGQIVRPRSGLALQDGEYRRAVGVCSSCRKRNPVGDVCQCGKWEC